MADEIEKRYERWVDSPRVSDAEKTLLKAMTAEQKADAFYKDIEFGTGGMRGLLGPGTNRINPLTVRKVTIAFGQILLEKDQDAASKGVVISHDNRHMSREFTLLAADVLSEQGIKVYIFDALRPTPELSFAVREKKAIGGIMITASHNPKEYNGYKIYDATGCQPTPEKMVDLLKRIEELGDPLDVEVSPVADKKGGIITLGKDIDDPYVKAVETIQLNPDLDKRGFKIVYTPNHGASYENAMRVFSDCGYDVTPVKSQCVHDPDFSGTLSPNPEEAKSFIEPIKLAERIRADLIVMTDPDGDRCGLAYLSSKGTYERLTGNESGALLIDYILGERKRQGKLPRNGVLYDTIVTSDLGRKIAHSYGVKTESFLTGFKYIGDRIDYYEEKGKGPAFQFGYEESYGCLIAPFVRDKDGIQAILLYCEMALYYHLKGIPLDVAYLNLSRRYGFHYERTDNVYFEGPDGARRMSAIMDELHENPPKKVAGSEVVRVEDYEKGYAYEGGRKSRLTLPKSEVVKLFLDDGSWVVVRPSGTEPKCKFYVEVVGKEGDDLQKRRDAISKDLLSAVGVKK
jgi:phosphoglucomutase